MGSGLQAFEQLRREAAAQGDVVMLPDVWEGYHNITHQTLEVCRVAALHPQATHTMKVLVSTPPPPPPPGGAQFASKSLPIPTYSSWRRSIPTAWLACARMDLTFICADTLVALTDAIDMSLFKKQQACQVEASINPAPCILAQHDAPIRLD